MDAGRSVVSGRRVRERTRRSIVRTCGAEKARTNGETIRDVGIGTGESSVAAACVDMVMSQMRWD